MRLRRRAELLPASSGSRHHVGVAASSPPDVGIGIGGYGAAEQQGRDQNDALDISRRCRWRPRRLDAARIGRFKKPTAYSSSLDASAQQ
jgi:hypothetical protein